MRSKMCESRHVHHTAIFGIELECLIHVGEKTGTGANVVFQDDDRIVRGEERGDALGDVALQIVVLGTFHEGDAVETPRSIGPLLELVQEFAHAPHSTPRCLVASTVGKDVEFGFGRQIIVGECSQRAARVVETIVDKERYGARLESAIAGE